MKGSPRVALPGDLDRWPRTDTDHAKRIRRHREAVRAVERAERSDTTHEVRVVLARQLAERRREAVAAGVDELALDDGDRADPTERFAFDVANPERGDFTSWASDEDELTRRWRRLRRALAARSFVAPGTSAGHRRLKEEVEKRRAELRATACPPENLDLRMDENDAQGFWADPEFMTWLGGFWRDEAPGRMAIPRPAQAKRETAIPGSAVAGDADATRSAQAAGNGTQPGGTARAGGALAEEERRTGLPAHAVITVRRPPHTVTPYTRAPYSTAAPADYMHSKRVFDTVERVARPSDIERPRVDAPVARPRPVPDREPTNSTVVQVALFALSVLGLSAASLYVLSLLQ